MDEFLVRLSTLSEVEGQQLINEFIPNWLVISLDGYSTDYPHLTDNWARLCKTLNVIPRKIILVVDLNLEEKTDPKNKVAEILTKRGYCIRRISEFVACPVCEKAIPCRQIWELLKEKGFPVPPSWSSACRDCRNG